MLHKKLCYYKKTKSLIKIIFEILLIFKTLIFKIVIYSETSICTKISYFKNLHKTPENKEVANHYAKDLRLGFYRPGPILYSISLLFDS